MIKQSHVVKFTILLPLRQKGNWSSDQGPLRYLLYIGGSQTTQLYTDYNNLVGGFNPFEKYARQIGNLPQIGVKIYKKK